MSLDLVRRPPTPSLGLSLFCGATIGFVIGAVAYAVCGILIDVLFGPLLLEPGKPQLSYGQQFGMIMMPLAGLLGAGAGLSVAVARQRPIVATIVLMGSVTICSALASMLWAQDVAQYGPDVSQIMLYVPFALVAAIVFLVSAGWIVVLTVHRP